MEWHCQITRVASTKGKRPRHRTAQREQSFSWHLRRFKMNIDSQRYMMVEMEMKRYQGFFSSLDQTNQRALPRSIAMEFFSKSGLGPQDIAALWRLIKTKRLQPDDNSLNETEFIIAMHLIVCMTKRGMSPLPVQFPDALFPTLDLPSSSRTPSRTSSFTSQPDPALTSMASDRSLAGSSASLSDTLKEKVEKGDSFISSIQEIDRSGAATLENLQECLHLIIHAVEQMGFMVPSQSKALDALDDLCALFRRHLQSLKQEVQTMELSSQILDEAEADRPIMNEEPVQNRFQHAASLVAQLNALHGEYDALDLKRHEVLQQLRQLRGNKVTTAQHDSLRTRTSSASHSSRTNSANNPFAMDASPPASLPHFPLA